MPEPRKFKLRVMNPEGMLFEGPAESLFAKGDEGEFEMLAFHYPVVSILVAGNLIIDWKKYIKIKGGLLKFSENDCVVLAET